MDVRDEHGRLLGWLSTAIDEGARGITIAEMEPLQPPPPGIDPNAPPPMNVTEHWLPIVTNKAEGWTALICKDLRILPRLPHFQWLPDDGCRK